MALTASLAACVIAVSSHYHVPAVKLAATVQRPAAFPTIGVAHIPKGWLPLLRQQGFHAKDIATKPCASVVAAGWILGYVQDVQVAWNHAKAKTLELPKRAQKWQPIIRYYARLAHVDSNLVNALILQESGFRPSLVSSAGAIGLMQITPATARALGVDPHNPAQNLWGGIWYMHNLLGRYHGDLVLALAAYNAGPTAVNKYGGIPPYHETEEYVPSVLRNYRDLLASSQSWRVARPLASLD